MELKNPDQKWLFADDMKQGQDLLGLLNGEEIIVSKDGKTQIPVLVFATDLSERTLINQWKIHAPLAAKKYGKDTAKWPQVSFYIRKRENKIELLPVEEDIQR